MRAGRARRSPASPGIKIRETKTLLVVNMVLLKQLIAVVKINLINAYI